MHAESRAKLVASMSSETGVVLLRGGVSACRNDSDHEELFRQAMIVHTITGTQNFLTLVTRSQESFFAYLFGVKVWG